jgi:hypothetical protein
MIYWRNLIGSLALGWSVTTALAAQPRDDAERSTPNDQRSTELFEAKVRPVLVRHCYDCHSAEAGVAEGGLRVDSREAIRKGGDRGPAVAPGKPADSWLLKAVTHADPKLKMPPKEPRLPKDVIADLTAWIRSGAADPREDTGRAASRLARADESHWAYQPMAEAPVPHVRDRNWAVSAIDRFVLAQLEAKGLSPSPDTSPAILLRRLHFDLVGLPPSLESIQRFRERLETSGLDRALVAEVDQLLASPRFGEKWGRHWLDVARFGESSGGEANISFPYAWRYRDYVIDCINADIPFDRFLEEQIAGDLLPYANDAERARLLIATGYLAIGPKNLGEANARQFQADVIDEQIDAVTRSLMASSVACARCHDHKFDPYSMQDYYALAGVFASTKTFFGTAVSPANRVAGDPLELPRIDSVKIFHRSIPAKRVTQLKADLAAMKREEELGRAAVREAVAAGRDPAGIFTLRDALRIFWRSGSIEGQLEKVDDSGRALPLAMGVLEGETVGPAPLLSNGDVSRPGDREPRRFPELFRPEDPELEIGPEESGRLQLARWLTHPRHPLTSRVIANRIWRQLFGAGIVETVDNFGSTGSPPSHPQLLDYLALRFSRQGGSIKQLVRDIALTRSYRQSSTFDRQSFELDPDNRLLWRAAKRRLHAEAIRDAMLLVSGELDSARPDASLVGRVIGDRPISLIGLDKRLPADLDGSQHRSVYLPAIRDRLPDALELFDFAEPSLVTGSRDSTNVPVQALYLMNSPFVQSRSTALAARLQRTAETNDERVVLAFLHCFGREPDDVERARSTRFLDGDGSRRSAIEGAPNRALISFCQALLCTAEFRNLD